MAWRSPLAGWGDRMIKPVARMCLKGIAATVAFPVCFLLLFVALAAAWPFVWMVNMLDWVFGD